MIFLRRLVLLLPLAIACGPSVDPAWLVVEARMTGLLASVDDAGDRVTPRPGETLRVQLLYAQPDGTPVRPSWVFLACEPAETSGFNFCAGEPIVFDAKADPDDEDRPFVVTLPEDYTNRNVLFVGAVCMNGAIDLTAADASEGFDPARICQDGVGVPQVFTFPHPVAIDAGRENRAPRIASITLGGEEWTAEPTTTGPCVGQGYPEVAYGSDPIEIVLLAREDDLELYERLSVDGELETVPEQIYVETLSPFRRIERRFTFITVEDPIADLEFEPIDEDISVPEGGLLVPIYFVMRDQRGGFDAATRAVCVTR
ncbi:MAG: hypothetical protein H6724_16845 [Sandaracinus sp.]|nr:hypothetical protein [Sandaracinus sp.]